MTVKQIITAHLKKVGATGLCRDGCGCRLADLMPCAGSMEDDCVPAVEGKCGPECEGCGGHGCMVPLVEASVESEDAGYPCGSPVCSAGNPALCLNDCVRNGRAERKGE
jgi:hypothetical protein